ncbi:hypothetical protein H112_02076 [Trichophyton rubrum D6]|uniref:Uncharacterized protein n=3 Tax=Trichophyton TaxID=5550 RepID=A0A080WWM6_TRIRC|nr:uncharacterized protein TERG_12459 [Trichophyton rubrum CBS 118892]EZF25646.1 hypothetical protein H100_02074 [Trichophyton rubrum MR850]EZF44691.1 hypothetical protein H102_02069 [Trichophyton rubrum CBS 100081]EZF55240.1 hypothetical protein H103_02079 [Trichophyton rubrum CBS 288.86]EZF65878.1 hypothetical protein H104_02056 [Trichophyton rubrum CBS 289.86]EZF76576.1 hypothetical protein H105_02088 [Trichophyton soudanense CBS 452.61]EZF87156.1 hypothetical protein H110_02077 [Trichophy
MQAQGSCNPGTSIYALSQDKHARVPLLRSSLRPSTTPRLREFRAGQRVPSSADELIHCFWLLESESMEGQKASSDVSHLSPCCLFFLVMQCHRVLLYLCLLRDLAFCISYSCFSVAFASVSICRCF